MKKKSKQSSSKHIFGDPEESKREKKPKKYFPKLKQKTQESYQKLLTGKIKKQFTFRHKIEIAENQR